ncbi:hypothetical protein M9H77_25320 [Catharanthus roseus]|uniref:Uncharacterized protein n=1 Tax=Catharanthus roseus TaxID=4058 RepID=A0ACC0A7U5_CATRO|nr:hypothetical protein M9H77_25320 [Catharanthus roseus]
MSISFFTYTNYSFTLQISIFFMALGFFFTVNILVLYEQGDVDPNMFEGFLEPEEYVDHGHLFTTNRIFNSKVELVDWAKEMAMKANTYLIINRYQRSRTADHRPYVTLACERGGVVKKTPKPVVNDEEEVPIKKRGPYGTKKYGCPFKLKGEQMATSDNWQLFLKQTEQFRKSHVSSRNILQFFFYRNCKESNALSDIVIAHPISIAMIRMWPYVLIMDTMYKTNKYNMPLLEAVGITPKNFIVATAFMQDVSVFWRTLEIGVNVPSAHVRDIESEMRDLTSILDEISTCPISKVWKYRRLMKRILCLVLPEDPCDDNCGFRVVANFLFGDENHWSEVRRQMTFDLQLHLNVIQRTQWFDGPAPQEHWLEIPDQLYVIANTFNFCVVLIATTVTGWMSIASFECAMRISSSYSIKRLGRALFRTDCRLG